MLRSLLKQSRRHIHLDSSSPPHVPLLLLLSSRRCAADYSTTTTSTSNTQLSNNLRNIAIIAHVDHGKTTLVDRLLSTSGKTITTDRIMDSNELEKERGITISAKCTSFEFEGSTFNIVDTPGHADFGGEVERSLGLVDGAILLVDASEGVMSQTKYVLQKALSRGLRPLVLLNKVDRPGATLERCGTTESDVFDTFASLGASEDQLDFPTMYASAREGWASLTLPTTPAALEAARADGMTPLLHTLRDYIPPPRPTVDSNTFSMLVVMTEKDSFVGRIATGRIASGEAVLNAPVKVISHADDGHQSGFRITKIMKRVGGMGTVELGWAGVGDIVSIAGASGAGVADTICGVDLEQGIPPGTVDPPTLSMVFSPNTSPLAGREGTALTGSKIGERLMAEAEVNVSLRVSAVQGGGGESFEVQARGELQLGLLIENMRREGFELSVSPPRVLLQDGDNPGEKLEPLEELVCEVEEQHGGEVIEALTIRRGELLEMGNVETVQGRQRLVFEVPARGLIGFRSVFATITRGTGLLHRAFAQWGPYRGAIHRVRKGSLIAVAGGRSTFHALGALDARGELFIEPGEEVYGGMVVGANARDEDLEVNPVREKKLTNVRNTGAEEKIHVTPAKKMTLEEAIGYVHGDEVIEVTPTAVRLRKRILDSGARRADNRKKKDRDS